MKFDVGDTVLLLHSGEEGVIVEILDNETVSVNVKEVIFPVYIDQLDFPYFKRFTENRPVTSKGTRTSGENLPVEKPAPITREETGVFLSFLPEYDNSPDDPMVQTLKIHLLNETALSYFFHYRLLLNKMLEIEVKNTLLPFTHFYLNDLAFDGLNDHPRFEFTFSPSDHSPLKMESYETVFKPKAKQVIQKLQSLQEKQDATFSYLLFEKYPDKAHQSNKGWNLPDPPGRIKYTNTVNPVTQPLPQYEVDLHIEKLIDHPEHLLPGDMLVIQLGELQRQLDLAIARRQLSLVVIHGIGKGTLRNEVHEILHHTPEVKTFVNQYDYRYGYGATEIFFEYK